MRNRILDTTATCLVALVIAGCGGDSGEPASGGAPAAVTPVPSATVVPTATAEIHASPTTVATATPTATATATPSGEGTGGAEAGDEEGVHVPVAVTVTADRIRASVEQVAAFLPLRFTVRNALDRELRVVVVRSGQGGGTLASVNVRAGGSAAVDVDGLEPGSLEVLSPDLDPDMTAIVRVEPGG
jgi:hypothetical protein